MTTTPTKRWCKSLPATFSSTQKYNTKRELASIPKQLICPPIAKKNWLQSERVPNVYGTATLVCFNDLSTELSKKYDRSVKELYVDQVFATPVKIGEGSFGKVYKALSKEDNQYYALKKIKSNHGRDNMYVEIKNLEKLDRRAVNCIKYHMAWEELGCVYIKLEYCPMSLSLYIWLNHNVCEDEMWYIATDITQALHYLHNKHLLHMDIKPSNIMISFEGRFKLGDFGLLYDMKKHNEYNNKTRKVINMFIDDNIDTGSNGCVTVGSSEGDSRYISQEVLSGVRHTSGDIFGLGITLLEICCDMELPKCGTFWEELRKLIFPEIKDDYSKKLIYFIADLMNPDYMKRPSTVTILKDNYIKKHINSERKKYAETFINQNSISFPIVVDSDSEVNENNNVNEISFDYQKNDDSFHTPPRNNHSILNSSCSPLRFLESSVVSSCECVPAKPVKSMNHRNSHHLPQTKLFV